jgi:hypothetical protein
MLRVDSPWLILPFVDIWPVFFFKLSDAAFREFHRGREV